MLKSCTRLHIDAEAEHEAVLAQPVDRGVVGRPDEHGRDEAALRRLHAGVCGLSANSLSASATASSGVTRPPWAASSVDA